VSRRRTAYECDSSKDFWKKKYLSFSGGKPLSRDLSPLRYPGGKGSLKYFLANTVNNNGLTGGVLVEPFCGGAGVSLPLLEAGIVNELHLNDANPAVAAFWNCMFFDTDAFVSLVATTPVTIEQWHRWREIMTAPDEAAVLELGFAAFFMNRCNRSGLLFGGPIGGFDQAGNYKIDCRFNRANLIERIQTISKHRDRVTVSNLDACDFLRGLDASLCREALIFIDPPYVAQGKNLYKTFSFGEKEHERLAKFVKTKKWRWVITYDDHPLIHRLYAERARGVIEFSYQMQQAKLGRELLVASSYCRIPFPGECEQLQNQEVNGRVRGASEAEAKRG
jgi:DNA adenine methylase